ncbi:hypothetical protein V1286_007628 [Bradyrhizobium algeriense]|uniref:Flagellin n=1 Tax=Bradyrhizobium algeriense TaxID=634784 RepID=A0ABU8BNG6_9BRAD
MLRGYNVLQSTIGVDQSVNVQTGLQLLAERHGNGI